MVRLQMVQCSQLNLDACIVMGLYTSLGQPAWENSCFMHDSVVNGFKIKWKYHVQV